MHVCILKCLCIYVNVCVYSVVPVGLIHVHRSTLQHSHSLVIGAIWVLGEIKVFYLLREKKQQKQPLCFVPTEGSCVPFRPGHRQALCCWAAGSCNPQVPLVTSPAGLLLIPTIVTPCSLIRLHVAIWPLFRTCKDDTVQREVGVINQGWSCKVKFKP